MILVPALPHIPRIGLSPAWIHRALGLYMAGLVFVVVSAAVFFGHEGGSTAPQAVFANPLKPSLLYSLTYLLTALLLGFRAAQVSRAHKGLITFFLIFGALHLVWMPLLPKDPLIARTFVLRMNVVAMTVCCRILLSQVSDLRLVLAAVRAVIAVTVAINLVVILAPQALPPGMVDYAGRAAGLYGNPNLCATFLAMLMPLAAFGLTTPRRLLLYGVVLVGVFLTFSRGGLIVWAMAVLLDLTFRPGDKTVGPRSITKNITIAGACCGLAMLLVWATWFDLLDLMMPYLNADTYARMNGTDQGSSNERWIVLLMGIEVFKDNPLFGAGHAATRIWDMRVSTHNMLVLMLAEFGVVGGIWYLAFLGRVLRFPCRFGLVLATLLAVESLFTHSYFDLPHYSTLILVYWRLAALSAGGQHG